MFTNWGSKLILGRRCLNGSARFLYTFSNWWYKALTMPNASHIIEVVFEGTLLITGFIYLIHWDSGRKLTNRQILYLFAVVFGICLVADILSSVVPTYAILIACSTPLLLRPLRTLLNSKPASQVKMFARKPSELPEKSE